MLGKPVPRLQKKWKNLVKDVVSYHKTKTRTIGCLMNRILGKFSYLLSQDEDQTRALHQLDIPRYAAYLKENASKPDKYPSLY
jgi:hypothetical protein